MNQILALLRAYSSPHVFNPWAHCDPMDAARSHAPKAREDRLRAHFDCRPRFLLIGEAPGYQGCHFSGIAFTNEKLILDGSIPRVTVTSRITTRPLPWCEPSATIVWRTLHALGIAEDSCMWNAFAFHPHDPGCPYTNRAPTPAELRAGKPALFAVLDHFHGAKVVAIGRVAEAALTALGIDCASVRHPARGGAKAFADGMRGIVGGVTA